jgi:hypothetical protein
MNWYDVLPRNVAKLQIAWERRERVRLAFAAGARATEIAAVLGVCQQRAYQMHNRQHAYRLHQPRSPAERYIHPAHRKVPHDPAATRHSPRRGRPDRYRLVPGGASDDSRGDTVRTGQPAGGEVVR